MCVSEPLLGSPIYFDHALYWNSERIASSKFSPELAACYRPTIELIDCGSVKFVVTCRRYDPDHHKDKTCRYNNNKGYVVFSAMGSFFIPLTVMVYVYTRISCVVAQRHNQLTALDSNDQVLYSHKSVCISVWVCMYVRDRDSVVGIATRHGVDGPELESQWRRDLADPSIPNSRSTQHPVLWLTDLSLGGKVVRTWRTPITLN